MITSALMDYQACSELELMSLASNYNAWIWTVIKPYIGRHVIEIGAGIGTFTEYLRSRPCVFATDIAQNCIEILRRRFYGSENVKVEILDMTQPPDFALWSSRTTDSLICLNVLEHIEDDVEALRNAHSMIISGGYIILMVPAFQCAYGTIDRLDGHVRRYSKNELIRKLQESRFEPVESFYFNSLGLIAWFFTNRVAKKSATSALDMKIYDALFVPMLRAIESLIRPPFGQSIIAFGKKA